MKIAQVCPRFPPYIGGVETHVYEISKRLVKEFNVEILTTDPGKKLFEVEKIDGISVRRFRSFAPFDSYFLSPNLHQYLKWSSEKYDIIHAHSYHAFPALYAAMTKRENKLVFTPHYHGRGHSYFRNLLHKPYKLFGRRIFEKADAIICVSKYEKNLILKNFDVDGYKVHIIPNGVNFDEFKNVDQIKKSKNHNKKIILYVGRLESYKGIDYIVGALSKLNEEFTLEIVGKGPYKRHVIRLANKLETLHRIRFYQDLSRQELVKKYANADVLVLLSKYEAYGLVVAEALAAKTPCIVAKEAALNEWIDDKSVFGVENPTDVEKLAELIENVVGITAVENERLMGWGDVVLRIKQIYKTLYE